MNDAERHLMTIFSAALGRGSPAERDAYLAEACGRDVALRARVEALLQAHDRAGGFLERDAVPVAGTATGDSSGDRPGLSAAPAGGPGAAVDAPGAVIGPYALVQAIGEGGMGTVYLAEQDRPVRRLVALKVIKAGMDSRQVLARFEAERQALALMDHPNIAKVLDAGATEAGRPYFVMELVKGVPITRFCDERRLTPRERLELFIPVCQAVQHAHQKGIIHRDLKPSNVLIGLYDGKPVPKVIDFGVAKAAGPKLTESTLLTGFGAVVGTPEYMSPEQAQLDNLDVDVRSDIYSLGVLLYELLTGTTPLHRKRLKEAALLEVLRVIREEEPPRPSTRLSATEELPSIAALRNVEPHKLTGLVRGELDWIVMKCLEKDRGRRYETANGLAMDLQRHLRDEQVQACPPSTWYRFRKFARRNRAVLLTAAVISVLLILGTLVSTWQAIRATRAERLAAHRLARERAAHREADEQRRKAEAQRQAADRARSQADANLRKARDAVDQMLTRVATERLRTVPQMEPVRRALMEDALKFYQGFLQEHSTDPAIRLETGEAYRRTGWIYDVLGQDLRAEEAYREAIALLEALAAEFPSRPDYRVALARARGGAAGILLHRGRFREAEQAYRGGLESWRALAAEFPANLGYRRAQADAARELGGFLNHVGRLAESEETYRQALVLQGELGNDPADSSLTQAKRLAQTGRPQEAETRYRQALRMLEERVAASPHDPTLRYALAYNQLELDLLLQSMGRRKEAEALIREAIAHIGPLVSDFPHTPQYRAGLADAYHHRFRLLVAERRFEEAEQTYRQSLPHVEKLTAEAPDWVWPWRLLHFHYRDYGRMLATAGRPRESEAAYRQALAVGKTLLADFPGNTKASAEVADTYLGWGLRLRDTGRLPEAEQAVREALVLFERQAANSPAEPRHQEHLALAHIHLGQFLRQAGRLDEAGQHSRKLAEVYDRLLKLRPDSAASYNNLAWLLATCPDAATRDPVRAVALAERAAELAPKQAGHWNTLGVARYRAGDWKGAIEALRKSDELTGGRDLAFDGYFLAMAHWQLGDKEEARKWYGKSVQWMEKNNPQDEELRRFRAEATELLGVTEPSETGGAAE